MAYKMVGRIRTHLANERTFLAWLQVGLTSIALGLAAAQLLGDDRLWGVPLHKVLSVGFVALGLALALNGRLRYRQAAIGIEQQNYRPRRRGLDLVMVLITIIGVVSLLFALRFQAPG